MDTLSLVGCQRLGFAVVRTTFEAIPRLRGLKQQFAWLFLFTSTAQLYACEKNNLTAWRRQAWHQGIEVQRLLRGLGKWHSPPFQEYSALSELYPEIPQWTSASRQKAQAVLDQSYIIEKEFEKYYARKKLNGKIIEVVYEKKTYIKHI